MRLGGRRLGGAAAGSVLTLVLGVAAISTLIEQGPTTSTGTAPISCDVKGQPPAPIKVTTGPIQQLTSEQATNARLIVAQGIADRVARDGLVISIMTALQESTLRNLNYGDRDSLGLFQQRAAWGPASDRTNPPKSAHMFFTGGQGGQRGLLDIPGWQSMPKWAAAQAVQVSAFPTAYAKWESLATSTVDAILSGSQIKPPPAPTPTPTGGDCAPPKPGPVKTACNAPTDLSAYSNGKIPLDKLCEVPWAKGQYLRSDALAGLEDLDKAYKAAFGTDICITEAYRTYDEQVRLYRIKPPGMAAKPGTSNHGWARAADLCGGIQADGTPQHLWMLRNAPNTRWNSPAWARPGASGPYEPWHWEYKT